MTDIHDEQRKVATGVTDGSKKDAALKLALDEFKHLKAWCLRSIGIGLVNENVIKAIEEALEDV